MIKEQNKSLERILLLTDLCLVIASFFIGYLIRKIIGDLRGTFTYYIELLPVLLIIWGILLYYFGMYKFIARKHIYETFLITLKTAFFGFIIFGSYVFILHKQEEVTRLFIGITFLTAIVLINLEKIILVYFYRFLSKKGTEFKSALFAIRAIIVVGTGKRAKDFVKLINKNPDWGIRIVGLIDKDYSKKGDIIEGREVLGTFDSMLEVIHKHVVDEVVFIVPRSWLNEIESLMQLCENEGLPVHVAADLYTLKFSRARQSDIQGLPLLTFENISNKLNLELLFVKRLFDFFVSGLLLILLFPLFLILSVLIKTTKGPILFKQVRCSLYGRKFTFYKFRTMIAEAESRLKDILEYNEMDGPVFKMTNDPRVTKIGKWLRKYSLDELPQLWNVFMGDMSLVGPRPPLPSEVEEYDNWQRRKLSMRPGITCLWQVSGRSEIADFNEWIRLDLEYIDNWSLWLDFKILLKTVPVVLSGKGAK